jgi:hypothetical protein
MKTHIRAAQKERGRVWHLFPLPLTPVLGQIRALCGARFGLNAVDEKTAHLHGCGRCDQRSRTAK